MNDQDTIERLRAQGVQAETVGEILGDTMGEAASPAPFVPPALEGTPPLPAPGIYFGMSDDDYHALPALSCSGIKKLAASPMIFWAGTPWLSEKKRQRIAEAKEGGEKAHFTFGKAYHCRIMEGASVFALRFAVELDPADFPDVLVSTAQIKAAISRHMRPQPVKVRSARKADMEAQLLELDPGRPELPGNVADLKAAITAFLVDQPVKPVRVVEDFMPDGGEAYMRDAVKADWIAQLLDLDPEAQIFDVIAEQHRAANPGKVFLTPDQHDELEIAALMIERDPEVQHAFKGGHAEVTLIWYCPRTGVPMKARVDYLKLRAMVDLKSVGNQRERSIENAIRFEIATYHYNIQAAVYLTGAKIVRDLIRQGEAAISGTAEQVAWAQKWARHTEPDEFLFVFQQKGEAPITRGVWFPRGSVLMVSNDIVSAAQKRFRQFSETYATDPWLDVAPVYTIADEEVPLSATEI